MVWRTLGSRTAKEQEQNRNINFLFSGVVLAWLSVWSDMQTCMWPS